MDIGSQASYPADALSNFSIHPFTFDGVECTSMEGFLQSLKFSNVDMQKYVCTLAGKAAKFKGKKKKWYRDQTLYWKGKPIKRDSQEYQDLIHNAYLAMCKNASFRAAIFASGDATYTHSIGKNKQNETVLTETEFIQCLNMCRTFIRKNY